MFSSDYEPVRRVFSPLLAWSSRTLLTRGQNWVVKVGEHGIEPPREPITRISHLTRVLEQDPKDFRPVGDYRHEACYLLQEAVLLARLPSPPVGAPTLVRLISALLEREDTSL